MSKIEYINEENYKDFVDDRFWGIEKLEGGKYPDCLGKYKLVCKPAIKEIEEGLNVVNAVRFYENADPQLEYVFLIDYYKNGLWNKKYVINTRRGFLFVADGDWIVTKFGGEKFILSSNEFNATYLPVSDKRYTKLYVEINDV